MSDPTPGPAGLPEPEVPEPEHAEPGPAAGGDETVRVPVEPEVAWNAPEPPRALPWETSAPGVAPGAPPAVTPPESTDLPPDGAWTTPPPAGVLSAATVGWVAPPPVPVATGNPGWVIASTGARFGAYLLDLILSGVIIGIALALAVSLAPDLADGGAMVSMAYSIGVTGFYFLYFVGFWTSPGKATPGMRLFKLQVANAADGKRLAIGPAIVRWLGLGYIFSVVGLFAPLAGVTGLVALFWYIALLITTANDRMHQGLHDRWAKSVIVRPEGAGSGAGGWLAACLIILLLLLLIPVVSIVALVLLGDQVSTILSSVGESI